MSSAERQRNFQAAHPGYDRRRKARRRAALKSERGRYLAELVAKATAEAQAIATEAVVAPAADAPVKPVLMLPAPVDDLSMAALDLLRASLERNAERHSPAAR